AKSPLRTNGPRSGYETGLAAESQSVRYTSRAARLTATSAISGSKNDVRYVESVAMDAAKYIPENPASSIDTRISSSLMPGRVSVNRVPEPVGGCPSHVSITLLSTEIRPNTMKNQNTTTENTTAW